MKLPAGARRLTRRALGMSRARAITPAELAAEPNTLIVAVGVLTAGSPDPRLPGEQRTASLRTLATVLADVPRDRPIALHCG